MKLINKDQVVSVTIHDEKLMVGYIFRPEKIYKIPFTNIVLSKTKSHWEYPNRYYSTYDQDDLSDFSVRNSKLYRKPKVVITFNSGWRDDVEMFFNTHQKAIDWVDKNLSGVPLVFINE
jgi:hypothetical protein